MRNVGVALTLPQPLLERLQAICAGRERGLQARLLREWVEAGVEDQEGGMRAERIAGALYQLEGALRALQDARDLLAGRK